MSTPTYQLAEDLIDRLTASVSADAQTYGIGSGLTCSGTAINGMSYPNVTISAGTTSQPWFTQNTASTKINLNGPEADIVVNGSSLIDAINTIQQRLNCLQVNPALEKEWNELKVLGDQYRKLEQEILDKQATWDRLKAMPKVDIE
jgi:hypothetical protein